jgi:serine/threonine-protein kinase
MPFIAGELVGPYHILEQLGQGGRATVYKACPAALARYVAIKALHPALLQEPNFLARFQREAKVIARLDRTHIILIYDQDIPAWIRAVASNLEYELQSTKVS